MTDHLKTIGILTGGGDCPGLNAVIRAVVLTASYKYGWICVGFLDGFEGLMDQRYINLTPQSVRGILPQGGTILGHLQSRQSLRMAGQGTWRNQESRPFRSSCSDHQRARTRCHNRHRRRRHNDRGQDVHG